MSENKNSLSGLRRKVKATLTGFGEENLNFVLYIPTKFEEKKEIEIVQSRISKISKGDSKSKEEGEKQSNKLMADLIYKFSNLNEVSIEIDGEKYGVNSGDELLEISTSLELSDFFMLLAGEQEALIRISRLSQKK